MTSQGEFLAMLSGVPVFFIAWADAAPGAGATVFTSEFVNQNATEDTMKMRMPFRCRLLSVRGLLRVNAAAGSADVVTVRKNKADTAMAVTQPDTAVVGDILTMTGGPVDYEAGDFFNLKRVAGGTAGANIIGWIAEFARL